MNKNHGLAQALLEDACRIAAHDFLIAQGACWLREFHGFPLVLSNLLPAALKSLTMLCICQRKNIATAR
jgi:hypothetical protein